MAKDEERENEELDEDVEEPEDDLEEETPAADDDEEPAADEDEEESAERAEEARKPKRRRKPRKRAAAPRRVMREEAGPELPLLVKLARWGIGVGLLILLVGFVGWIAWKTFNWPVRIIIIAGGGVLIASIVVLGEEALALVKRRATLSAANTAVALVAMLGILVLANYVSMRYVNAKWDATQNKRFSLSSMSAEVVKSLDEKAEVFAFYDQGSPWGQGQAAEANELLSMYADVSPKLAYQVYDTATDLKEVQEHSVTRSGTIILKVGDRTKEVSTANEQEITNALVELTTKEQPKLYFLTGHGERSLEWTQDGSGYSEAKRLLEGQKYIIETLNLREQEEAKVPDDCDCLVILGPKSALHEKETKAIKAYLGDDGRAFIALEPPPGPSLSGILGEYGVKVEEGVVVDPAQSLQGSPYLPMVESTGGHQIATALTGYRVVMRLPRVVQVEQPEQPPEPYGGAPPPTPATPVAETSGQAYSRQMGDDPTELARGPFPLVVAVEKSDQPQPPPIPGQPPPEPEKGTRVVVVGSADMASDGFITSRVDMPGNRTLWTAAIGWLAQRAALVTVPPKSTETKRFTPTSVQRVLILILTVFIVPALAAGAGFVVWWRRR